MQKEKRFTGGGVRFNAAKRVMIRASGMTCSISCCTSRLAAPEKTSVFFATTRIFRRLQSNLLDRHWSWLVWPEHSWRSSGFSSASWQRRAVSAVEPENQLDVNRSRERQGVLLWNVRWYCVHPLRTRDQSSDRLRQNTSIDRRRERLISCPTYPSNDQEWRRWCEHH